MHLKTFILIVATLLLSCKKNKIGPQIEESSPLSGYKVNILNEGVWGASNASITQYNPYTQESANHVFESLNGVPVGDVLQSATYHEGKNYLVVNSSGKIIVVDSASNQLLYEINNLGTPRYIAISNNKGFVSDISGNKVTVIDLISRQVIGNINFPGWTEHLVLLNGSIYVSCRGGFANDRGNNHIYKIDVNSYEKTDSIEVGIDPTGMVIDENENIWILTTGGNDIENPKLMCLNSALVIVKSIEFPFASDVFPDRLCTNGTGSKLYFLEKGVYELSIYANNIPSSPIIDGSNRSFYGLGIDPSNDEIYISDIPNFTSNATMYRYYPNGNVKDEFTCGIGANFIQF